MLDARIFRLICAWCHKTVTHAGLYLSAGSVGMSVRSAVNAVLTELVRSLSRALAAFLWRYSLGGDESGGTSLAAMPPTSIPPPPPPHSFLFLFTLMWKADGEDEDKRKAALEELLVRSSEPEPSLPFSSSSSERRAMSPYRKRPAGGAVRSMANVILGATAWQLPVSLVGASSRQGWADEACWLKLAEGVHQRYFPQNFSSSQNKLSQENRMFPLRV